MGSFNLCWNYRCLLPMENLGILSVLTNTLCKLSQAGAGRLKQKEGAWEMRMDMVAQWKALPLVAGGVHCRPKALPHGSVHRVCGSLWAPSAPAPSHSESESEESSELDALLLLSDLFSLSSASSSSSSSSSFWRQIQLRLWCCA